MLRKLKFIVFLALSLATLFIFTNIKVSASNVNGIAMEPIYPKNQISKNGILNPKVNPGSIQKLSFNIINLSSQPMSVSIVPNTAVTSSSPAIDYSKSNYKYDSSLKYNFRNLVTSKIRRINLQSNKPTQVTFNVRVPKNKFYGLIMGGFYISTPETSSTNNSATAINNKYSYAMPVILREDLKKVFPKMTLGNVFTNNSDNKPVVNSVIYNKRPAMIDGLSMDTTISTSDGKNIYHNLNSDNSVSPNSHFTYSNKIFNKTNLSPGKYHIVIVAKSSVGEWIMQKDFTVNVSQYIGTIFNNNSWLWLLLLLLVLVIIFIIVYIIYRKHKNKLEDSKNAKAENSFSRKKLYDNK